MKIGQLATTTGVSVKTLRFYEEQGLLPEPARTPSGYRNYPEDATARVAFIRTAQTAGLKLAQIGEILDIREQGRPPCEHVRRLVTDRLDEVEERLADLNRTPANSSPSPTGSTTSNPPTAPPTATPSNRRPTTHDLQGA